MFCQLRTNGRFTCYATLIACKSECPVCHEDATRSNSRCSLALRETCSRLLTREWWIYWQCYVCGSRHTRATHCSAEYLCKHVETTVALETHKVHIKTYNAIPVTGREGPQGCETSRLPHFLQNRLTDSGEVVRLTRRTFFTPGRFLVLISVRGWVDSMTIVRLEELGQL
jgi:hypothetical protein